MSILKNIKDISIKIKIEAIQVNLCKRKKRVHKAVERETNFIEKVKVYLFICRYNANI